MNLYKIVKHKSLPVLQSLVVVNLNSGWTLAGGIAKDGLYYLQAVTKAPQELNIQDK